MISLHSYEAQDWSGNGECGLYPDVCDIKKVAAGLYELELEHQITDDGRALAIQRGMLIKAPVPARETPLISISAQGHAGQAQHDIWAVHITASYARLYNKASTGGKVLERLKNGVELVYLSKYNDNWHKVTAPSGKTGYMRNADIQFLRTEPYIPALPSYQTAVLPRQVREQLFRVYDVNTDDETHKVKALARHISYGQLRNFVKTFSPKNMELQTALDAMSADLINEHDYHYYTNISGTITADWALKNGVQAILDPDEGAAIKMNAQVVRDNFDIFLLQNTEIDRDVVIESGKNLLGLTCHVNDDNVVTRIMPYGTDAAGKILLLPEIYIDSQYFGNYPEPRAIPLQVSEAVERAASGNDPGMTKEQAYAKLRAAVQAKYDAGIDLPDFDIQVKFLQLGDTEEYKALKELEKVYLYDTVTVKHGQLGMLYKVQMIGYTFDAVLERYTDVTFGNIKNGAELGTIAGFQLPNGGVSGQKLMPGSVGSQQLRELSVLAAHIGLAQIVNAHIQDATIDKAKIKDFVAEVAAIAVAKIGDAWIDSAWINKLTAEVVDIVTANIDTLIANSATIQWAQIANLTAAVTDIVLAKIKTANIGWAQIKGLVADTALFTQGASGKLYCADFMATDANIESLSANKIAGGMATFGKLMLMGQNSKLYEINVGSLGEVTATEKKMGGDNVGDYVLTQRNLADGTLTARTLNVQDIFADSALVRQLIAQNIDTNTLFANLGYINALKTHLIQSDIGEFLNLESNTGIQLMVSDALSSVNPSDTNLLSQSKLMYTSAMGVQYMAEFDLSGKLLPNTQYSFTLRGQRIQDPSKIISYVHNAGWTWWANGIEITEWPMTTKSFIFTTPADTSAIFIGIENNDGSGSFGRVHIEWAKLVEGNKPALEWSPAPSDPATKVQTPYIILDEYGITQSGGRIRQIADDYEFTTLTEGEVAMTMNSKGESTMKSLSVTSGLKAPDVHPVYTGPSNIPWAGSVRATADKVNGKYLPYDCQITIPTGVWPETLEIHDVSGHKLTVLYSSGTVLSGRPYSHDCSAQIIIGGPSMADYGAVLLSFDSMVFEKCFAPIVQNMRISGKNRTSIGDTTNTVLAISACPGFIVRNSIVERSRWAAIAVGEGSTGRIENCVGGQVGGDYKTVANLDTGVSIGPGCHVALIGTIPHGNAAVAYAQPGATAPGGATGAASPGTTPPAPTTRTLLYTALESGSLYKNSSGNWSWVTGTSDVWHCDSANFGTREGFWCLTNANNIAAQVGAGTILSAKLTLQRYNGYGENAAVALALRTHAYATKAGYTNTGTTINPAMSSVVISPTFVMGEMKTIDLPSSLFAGLKNGTIKGFGVLADDPTVRMTTLCTLELVVQGGP